MAVKQVPQERSATYQMCCEMVFYDCVDRVQRTREGAVTYAEQEGPM